MKGGVPGGAPGTPGTSGTGGTSSGTGGGNSKMNKPMKTSQIFNLDKNSSWSSLFASRFETIKAVANKRSPTTKPLVVNPSQVRVSTLPKKKLIFFGHINLFLSGVFHDNNHSIII